MSPTPEDTNSKTYRFGPFELDTDSGVLWRKEEGTTNKLVPLTGKTFQVLVLLVNHAGKAVTMDMIIDKISPPDRPVDENNVVGRISKIRSCLSDDPKNPTYIKTLRNKPGYLFNEDQLIRESTPANVVGAQGPFAPETDEVGSVNFSELDSIHVHVDGGSEEAPIVEIVNRFSREGKRSKINSVVDFTTGPQREDDPLTYIPHTPGGIDNENLEYFSTHLFGDFAETKSGLRQLLTRLPEHGCDGMVIEAERIIGKFSDERIQWSETYIHHFPVLCTGDVGYEVSKTKPIEIHYALDIPKQGRWATEPPLDLKELPKLTTRLGIRVGGWFLFDKHEQNKWAYRSNMFEKESQQDEIEKNRCRLRAALEEIGNSKGFTCEVRALVEQTIGIWNTPLKSVCQPRSVDELSDWEAKYPNLRDFWVVTPNFLGDKSKPIQDAMIGNLLNRNVTYTYFLKSIADYNRLLSLAEELERKLRGYVIVSDRIRAVLVLRGASDKAALEKVFNKQGDVQGYFIANPLPRNDGVDDVDGYMLERSENAGEISGGRVMNREQIKKIVELLKPLVPSGSGLQGYCLPLSPQKSEEVRGATIICIGLKGLPQLLNDVDDENNACRLREYDLLVASETSKLGGQVVRSIDSGYLLMFEGQNEALLCAEQLQKEIDLPLNQKIAIDIGDVWRVMRAHGFDYCGKTLTRCRKLLKETKYGEVRMTNSFYKELGKKYVTKLVPAKEELDFENSKSKIWKLVL